MSVISRMECEKIISSRYWVSGQCQKILLKWFCIFICIHRIPLGDDSTCSEYSKWSFFLCNDLFSIMCKIQFSSFITTWLDIAIPAFRKCQRNYITFCSCVLLWVSLAPNVKYILSVHSDSCNCEMYLSVQNFLLTHPVVLICPMSTPILWRRSSLL